MLNVIVPTLNAATDWPRFAQALLACVSPEQVLIIDSASSDGTPDLARAAGFQVYSIRRIDFNHGATRQLAARMLPDAEFLVYMTQDAVLANSNSISQLLTAFDDPAVAAAYGRQLPRPKAKAMEAHARLFNYPETSDVRALASREYLGYKTIFISNSFSAYRRSALMAVGGFQADVILGEDTVTAAKLLLAEWKVAYVAEAQVYHSHEYTAMQHFRRYFDIGVLHSREPWLLDGFGLANGEGKRFVISELEYLRKRNARHIPAALIHTGLKLLGYRMGRMENHLPPTIKPQLSMHRGFWKPSHYPVP